MIFDSLLCCPRSSCWIKPDAALQEIRKQAPAVRGDTRVRQGAGCAVVVDCVEGQGGEFIVPEKVVFNCFTAVGVRGCPRGWNDPVFICDDN